jgi:hypothetical protein
MAPTAAANHAAWQPERGDFLHRIGCRRRHQAPMRGLFRGCGTIATRAVADAPALAERRSRNSCSMSLFDFAAQSPPYKSLKKIELFFVAVRRQVEIFRNFLEPLRFDDLLVSFDEPLVRVPGNASALHGRPLRPRCNLVGMEIVQSKLVEECFFNNLMREKEWLDTHSSRPGAERARQMSVDEDRLRIDAVAGHIGDIMAVVDRAHPAAKRLDGIVHDVVRDVLGPGSRFIVQLHVSVISRARSY